MRMSTINTPTGVLSANVPGDTGFRYVLVNLSGRLSVLDAPRGVGGLFPLVRRIDLDHGLVCWLDGDDQDGTGEVNPAATQICLDLIGRHRSWPFDEPHVCGPALFTGLNGDRPVGLRDQGLRLLTDVHASADQWAASSLECPDHLTLEWSLS